MDIKTKDKCPLTIPDWVNFLECRSAEKANMILLKKGMGINRISNLLSVVSVAFLGILYIITISESDKSSLVNLIFAVTIFMLTGILIRTIIMNREFENYREWMSENILSIDSIVTKIIDNELKTSEEIRDEWFKICNDFLK